MNAKILVAFVSLLYSFKITAQVNLYTFVQDTINYEYQHLENNLGNNSNI